MSEDLARDRFARIRPFVTRHGRALDAALLALIAAVSLAALAGDHPRLASGGAFILLCLSSLANGWPLKLLAWSPVVAIGAVSWADAPLNTSLVIAVVVLTFALMKLVQRRRGRDQDEENLR